jgi:hypothetical protein
MVPAQTVIGWSVNAQRSFWQSDEADPDDCACEPPGLPREYGRRFYLNLKSTAEAWIIGNRSKSACFEI